MNRFNDDFIFIERKANNLKAGYYSNNQLLDFTVIEGNLQSIYRGKINNIVPSINAAFIDIGEEENGYLKFENRMGGLEVTSKKGKKIENYFKAGESVLVQITKESTGSKGAKLTKNIEIPGKYIILTPYSNRVNISRKIGKENRGFFRKFGEAIKKDNIGMIIRTSASKNKLEKIEREYEELIEIFNFIKKQRDFLPVPKLIYRFNRELIEFINFYRDKFDYILTNTELNFIDKRELEGIKVIESEKFSIDYDSLINPEISRALSRSLTLKSGGNLIIDELEALTVIDVNTASNNRYRNLKQTSLKTNLEAIDTIVRQIRVRNLSGIILIDFINMDRKKDKLRLLSSLKKKISQDRIKTNLIDITKLGIVELTRERKSKTLREVYLKECDTCQTRGFIRK